MLAIQRRYKSLKYFSAGSLAFAIGLTGAAAYVGGTLVHQNLTFNKEQAIKNESPSESPTATDQGTVTVESPSDGVTDLPTANQSSAQPSPSWATIPAPSTDATAGVSVSGSDATSSVSVESSGSTTPTNPINPGGGSTDPVTIPPIILPLSDPDLDVGL